MDHPIVGEMARRLAKAKLQPLQAAPKAKPQPEKRVDPEDGVTRRL